MFQYLGRPAPVSTVILYCFCYYCMTLCAKFINKIKIKINKEVITGSDN